MKESEMWQEPTSLCNPKDECEDCVLLRELAKALVSEQREEELE
jgi:hypothetical protein